MDCRPHRTAHTRSATHACDLSPHPSRLASFTANNDETRLQGGFKCDEGCSLQPKLGDYSLTRACRVIPEAPVHLTEGASEEQAGSSEATPPGSGAGGGEEGEGGRCVLTVLEVFEWLYGQSFEVLQLLQLYNVWSR